MFVLGFHWLFNNMTINKDLKLEYSNIKGPVNWIGNETIKFI